VAADDPPPPTDRAADYELEGGGKYYRGRIVKLQRGAGRGRLRSVSTGRDIPFVFQFVTMVGPHGRFEDLREGMEVGFDVSWTSRGLRVSVIRIPD
jgi:hypothetical protein